MAGDISVTGFMKVQCANVPHRHCCAGLCHCILDQDDCEQFKEKQTSQSVFSPCSRKIMCTVRPPADGAVEMGLNM